MLTHKRKRREAEKKWRGGKGPKPIGMGKNTGKGSKRRAVERRGGKGTRSEEKGISQ